MPLSGVLCRGERVELGWPEEHEFDALTALRNRPAVRARFVDPRPLDVAANRVWLRSGMKRPHEGLLAIRAIDDASLVGMIGWSKWDPDERTVELGRLVVDAGAAAAHPALRVPGYAGIAMDAAVALRDCLFEALDLAVIRTVYLADNAHARRVNRLGGARPTAVTAIARADGSTVDLVHLQITRAEWQALRARRTS